VKYSNPLEWSVSVAICALLEEMSSCRHHAPPPADRSRKGGHGYSRECLPTHCRCLPPTADSPPTSASPPPLSPPPLRCLLHLRCIPPLPLPPPAVATSRTCRFLSVPPMPSPTADVTHAASIAAPRCPQEPR